MSEGVASGASRPGDGAAIGTATASPRTRFVRARAWDSLSRIFAMLLLPLSIAPVLLLGPSMLRAPIALGHEAWGQALRLERTLAPARPVHSPAPLAPLGPSAWRAVGSLGPIYGRWSAFPAPGLVGFQRDSGASAQAAAVPTTVTALLTAAPAGGTAR